MRVPMPPSRQSSQSSGWVLIDEFEASSFTRSRSPQLNANNMSSSQVPSISAKSSSSICLVSEAASFTNNVNGVNVDDEPYRFDHKPSSNSSTDTAGTNNTLTPAHAHAATLAALLASFTTRPVDPTLPPPLTVANMSLHQRQLAECWSDGVTGWLDGAGTGVHRLLGGPSQGPGHRRHGSITSVLAVRHGTTSWSSGATADWPVMPQRTTVEEDIAAMGTWCEAPGGVAPAVVPGRRRVSVVSVETEEGGVRL